MNEINKELSIKLFENIPEVLVPSIGLGTMRTSATYIAVLLQLEAEETRIEILVDIAKKLGFSLEDIEKEYNNPMCPNCGMSMKLHEVKGECP